jgi:hypothetical protein
VRAKTNENLAWSPWRVNKGRAEADQEHCGARLLESKIWARTEILDKSCCARRTETGNRHRREIPSRGKSSLDRRPGDREACARETISRSQELNSRLNKDRILPLDKIKSQKIDPENETDSARLGYERRRKSLH